MIPEEFYRSRTVGECRRVAEGAGTSLENFRNICLYGGAVSRALAKALSDASGGAMSRDEILFPDDYKDRPAKPARRRG